MRPPPPRPRPWQPEGRGGGGSGWSSTWEGAWWSWGGTRATATATATATARETADLPLRGGGRSWPTAASRRPCSSLGPAERRRSPPPPARKPRSRLLLIRAQPSPGLPRYQPHLHLLSPWLGASRGGSPADLLMGRYGSGDKDGKTTNVKGGGETNEKGRERRGGSKCHVRKSAEGAELTPFGFYPGSDRRRGISSAPRFGGCEAWPARRCSSAP